jgi:hypothetical protein
MWFFLTARKRSVPRAWPFLVHVLAHTRGEKSLARLIEPDASALLNQHADFTQFMFRQTHLAALKFTSSFLDLLRHASSTTKSHQLSKGACCHGLPVDFLGRQAVLLGRCAELRERFVQLIGKFDELADSCDGAARAL